MESSAAPRVTVARVAAASAWVAAAGCVAAAGGVAAAALEVFILSLLVVDQAMGQGVVLECREFSKLFPGMLATLFILVIN